MAFNLLSWLNPLRFLQTIEVIMSKMKHRFHPMSSHQKYQYQTLDRVFDVIFRHWEVVWKKKAQPSFARPSLRSLDIGWNTDWNLIQKCIASLTNKKFWRNSMLKFTESYRSCLWYPNHCQSSDFLSFMDYFLRIKLICGLWFTFEFVRFDFFLS